MVKKAQGEAYATLASYTPPDLPSWEGPNVPRPHTEIPVVFYHGRPGEAPCYKGHFVHTAVTQVLASVRQGPLCALHRNAGILCAPLQWPPAC